LKQLRESGSIKKIVDSYDIEEQVCPDYSGQALGFASCFTAFLVFLFGLLCAAILFAAEHCLEVTET